MIRLRPADRRSGERGQALVEFSMVVPVFMLILLGLLEFGFAFDHQLTLSYASREGARTAAALAAGADLADCRDVDAYVVSAVERVLDSPGSPVAGNLGQVSQIRVYKAGTTGGELGPVNVWTPGNGPTVDGKQLHFAATSSGWNSCTRSNLITNPDSAGISITYAYRAVTPLSSLLAFFGGEGWRTLVMTDRTVMALNPTD